MASFKFNRMMIGGTCVLATGAMILLAMALAQRDKRIENSSPSNLALPYANQPAQGIALDRNSLNPPFIYRGNDSPLDSTAENRSSGSAINPFASPRHLTTLSSGGLQSPAVPPIRNSYAPLSSTRSDANVAPELLSSPRVSSSLSDNNSLTNSSVPPEDRLTATAIPADSLSNAANNSIIESTGLPATLDLPAATPRNLSSSPFSSSQSAGISNSPNPNQTAPSSALTNQNYSPSLPSSVPPFASDNGTAEVTLQSPTLPTQSIPSTNLSEIRSSGNEMGLSSLSNTRDAPGMSKDNSVYSGNVPSSTPPLTSDSALPNARNASGSNDAIRGFASQRSETASVSSMSNAEMNSNSLSPGRSNGATPIGPASWNSFASPAPGTRKLDGSQNPSMEIQKRAPAEVQVGFPATFTILVRNVGTSTAFDVAVHDAVPNGAKLVRASPPAQVDSDGKILWKLGEIPASAEQVLTLEIIPENEGELGSVASVTFAAQASVRTMSTQPKLQIKQLASDSVLGGETVRISIEITNIGTGTARDVELQEDVPQNMRHALGVVSLAHDIGNLAPGESQIVDIELQAVSAGKATNIVRAVSTNTATQESKANIDVVLPKLGVQLEGPRLRYLERQATYRATVANTGTAVANNVELLVHLPRGLEFNSAADDGVYLPDQHAVAWSLAELAAGTSATTEMVLLPVVEGDYVLRMQGYADGVRAEPIDKKVLVEGQSELAFSIEDDNDPIETDGYTTYIVKITNAGTRTDSDVILTIEMPEGATIEQVHAPVNYQKSPKGIQFAPLSIMQPKDQQIYRIAVRHSREGTHVLRAQLRSKNRPVAVTKEESTQVYLDQ